MASAVEKLIYRVAMIDQMSEPAKKISATITKMQRSAKDGLMNIAKGTAGLIGAGYTVHKLTEPAVQMNRALGEVASLDVDPKELELLEKTANRFAMRYGQDATAFVRSSYDIQSAIAGLRNGELAEFTRASNLLAKGTKADAATATNYMSTMYGIFQKQAEAMGKAEWVQQMTGQTAAAVRMFKTNGMEMASAFSAIGSTAEKAGVAASEQLAILGQLQTTMSGSEAATRYQSFILGVGKAQEALGMQFTDAQGKMLPTVEILEKLRERFGNMDTVATQDLLMKAFGRKEAVALVTNLIDKTDMLRGNMQELESITGLGPAEAMAAKMTDTQMQLSATFTVLRTQIGKAVNLALAPFLKWLTGIVGRLSEWLEANPRMAKWLGVLVVGFVGVTAAISALAVALGVVQVIYAGVLAIKAIVIAVKTWTAGQWSLNAAMAANPIGLIIAAVAALTIGVIAAIKYWDDMATWMKWTALILLGPLGAAIVLIVKYWDEVKAAGVGAWQAIAEWGSAAVDLVKGMFGSMVENVLGGVRNILSVLAKVPGAGKMAAAAIGKIDSFSLNASGPKVEGGRNQAKALDVPAGGLRQSISSSSRNTTYGDVHINAQRGPGPAELEEWLALQFG